MDKLGEVTRLKKYYKFGQWFLLLTFIAVLVDGIACAGLLVFEQPSTKVINYSEAHPFTSGFAQAQVKGKIPKNVTVWEKKPSDLLNTTLDLMLPLMLTFLITGSVVFYAKQVIAEKEKEPEPEKDAPEEKDAG